MSDIKLFQTGADGVSELKGGSMALERSLQTLIELNMDAFIGVRFLASEFRTTHGGRMDSLGIDENGSPVIIEYKRSTNENVINQGLFYLDWLMDHRRDFEWLVLEKYGKEQADAVDWSTPRLICIAGDFTKYDAHAVNQMNHNIELVRYRRFGEELLLFELLTSTAERPVVEVSSDAPHERLAAGKTAKKYKTVSDYLADADQETVDIFEAIKAYLMALGDDVQLKTLDFYFAFRTLKNFACVEIRPQLRHIKLYLKIDPTTLDEVPGFIRDVSQIGHFGTGDVEVIVSDWPTFEKAKPLMDRSYTGA